VVSLSPTQDSSAADILRYDAGWAATNKLVRAGYSFSGRERNCAFLNLGAQRFANISAAANLDLIDDGRGLALCDWDWDGKIDIWLTNRTGPRLRFLHNCFAAANNFMSIRLKGTRSNRDAIGARVEVLTAASDPPNIKTLYCGSGFLSQSTKWLQFGLGKATSAEVVRVHWPAGKTQTWKGLRANTFYELEEGVDGQRIVDPPSKRREILPSEPETPGPGGTARVVLLNPAPVPEIPYLAKDGHAATLDSHRGKPLLVHLWATWCPNCAAEMTAWKQETAAFESSGLDVLSLCVDEPGETLEKDLAHALASARELQYDMPVGLVRGDALETLNVLQKSFIGRQTDLPLPSSFLIDGGGRLAIIYKGPVAATRVLADLDLLEAPPARIVAAAAPSQGRWLEIPRGGEPRGIAVALAEHGMDRAATDYLHRLIPLLEEPMAQATDEEETLRLTELAECHIFLGALAFDDSRYEESIAHHRRALEFNPESVRARDELIRALLELNRKEEALVEVLALLERQPAPERQRTAARLLQDLQRIPEAIEMLQTAYAAQPAADAAFELANMLRDADRAEEAIGFYREALEKRSNWALPANNLAWILATHSGPNVRNGAEAVRLALAAEEATGGQIPQFCGTLAAAYAEAGEFEKAVEAAERGIARARQSGDTELAARLIERKALYKSGKPYRDVPQTSSE
jgi:tetratricopeptide (TPR) repeat protein